MESRQNETESENDEHKDKCFVPGEDQCVVTACKSLVLSESDSSIGERLVMAVELTKPELCSQRVAMETAIETDESEEGEVVAAEQFPDLSTVDTVDSFTRIKELAEKICPESTMGWVFSKKGLIVSFVAFFTLESI